MGLSLAVLLSHNNVVITVDIILVKVEKINNWWSLLKATILRISSQSMRKEA